MRMRRRKGKNMAFKYLSDEEIDNLTLEELSAYNQAEYEYRLNNPRVRSIYKYMQLRNPVTGETIPYMYWITERKNGDCRDNHDFRRDGAINAYVRNQMCKEGKIHPADFGDGERHSVLTASIPKELEQEYSDRCDAAFASFTIDEPSGKPDEIKEAVFGPTHLPSPSK